MNTETPKIEIYRTRTFSEKLSDTFAFLRENWRPIMKYYVYFMLPLSILLAFPTSHFFSKYFELVIALENDFANFNWVSFAVSAVASVILAMVTAIVLTSLFFSMVRLYSAREMRLQALEFEELKQEMLFCAKRTLILMATGIAIGLIIMIVFIGIIAIIISMSSGVAGAISSVFGMLLLYIGLIVVIPPLQLVTPIYLMEDETGVIDAYRKAFRLGFATWGGVFAVTFVVGLLASVIQSFTTAPWYIIEVAKMVVTEINNGDSGFTGSFIYITVEYLTCILMCMGYFLYMIINYTGIVIQYGHACEKIDGTGVAEKIEKFDEFDNF